MKIALNLCLYFICLLSLSYAEGKKENIEIIGCDDDVLTSILQEPRDKDDYIVSIRCTAFLEFEPSQFITEAKIIDVVADADQRYIHLIMIPNTKRKTQRLNILHSDNYADDGQLQGTGSGGYVIEGDKLYAYLYWGSGCKFDRPYEVEKITYKWDKKQTQYIKKDDIYYTTKEQASRGHDCCDAGLLEASDQLTNEQKQLLDELTIRDAAKKARLLWGKEAQELLAETQLKLTEQIKTVSLWRQEFCCGYEEDEYRCLEEIIQSRRK